ncbi:unnamed protein product [Orchesella dallaii]|uniref:Uncharacterized protein n=1 Tax=Orchesella dallaii TaxID=48710 RepID=A0ABP1PJL4_9HEXA
MVGENTTEVCVWHVDLKSTIEAPSRINLKWNPTLLVLDTTWGRDCLFVITGYVNFTRKCVSWMCLQIFGTESDSNYEAEFTLLNAVTKTSPLKWTIPVVDIQTDARDQIDFQQMSPVEIPFCFLKQVCGNMRNFPITVKIQPSLGVEKEGPLRKYIAVRTHTSEIY